MRIERIDRIGLELGAEYKSRFHVEENDPLSAVAELRQTQTMSRDAWQIRIETHMRLSCTRDTFLLQGGLRAWEGANESVVANGIALSLEISCDDPSDGLFAARALVRL